MIPVLLKTTCEINENLQKLKTQWVNINLNVDSCVEFEITYRDTGLKKLFKVPNFARLAIKIHTMMIKGPETRSKSNLATLSGGGSSWLELFSDCCECDSFALAPIVIRQIKTTATKNKAERLLRDILVCPLNYIKALFIYYADEWLAIYPS